MPKTKHKSIIEGTLCNMSAVLDLDGEFFDDPPPLLLFPLDIV